MVCIQSVQDERLKVDSALVLTDPNNKVVYMVKDEDEIYQKKRYIHFDHRKEYKQVKSYVSNPQKIAKHSFLPFIYFPIVFEKFSEEKNVEKNNRPVKVKKREIMYAGHLDNFIYKHYSIKLNNKYNEWMMNQGIDECSIAYRNKGNNEVNFSNITSAAEVINKIVSYNEAYILIGDFTNFFGSLNHRLLKKRLKLVLSEDRLKADWFNVFNSITRYGFYDKEILIREKGTDKELKKNKQYSYFKKLSDYRDFSRKIPCKSNKNNYGIPQGSAISAILANVYAIEFDKKAKELASKYKGIYRRYSDDFILVIPKESLTTSNFIHIRDEIVKLSKDNEIELQKEKTKSYLYENKKIINIDEVDNFHIDYLGFTFDGENVKMRNKSSYKFYRNAYKLIRKAHYVKRKKNLKRIPYRRKIYRYFTDLGVFPEKYNSEIKLDVRRYGNFISYAYRCQKSFDEISPLTNNLMMQQIKNRKKYIEKRLGYRIHTKV